MNLLIIEDDKEMINTLLLSLKNLFNIFTADNVSDAISIISKHKIDVITLDRSLEKNDDGLNIAKYLKSNFFNYECPPHLIIISNKTKEKEISFGFSLHADYYISKPVNISQVIQILQNIKSRRLASIYNDDIYSYGKISIRNSKVFYDGVVIKLSKAKLKLLKTLIKNVGKIISRDYLLDILYEDESDKDVTPRVIDTYIHHLKKELNLNSNLKSIYGKGYILIKKAP